MDSIDRDVRTQYRFCLLQEAATDQAISRTKMQKLICMAVEDLSTESLARMLRLAAREYPEI